MEVPRLTHYSKPQWDARETEAVVSKEDINDMIMNYLIVEGYGAAATKFAEEADINGAGATGTSNTSTGTSNNNLFNNQTTEIQQRKEIKSLIHEGQIKQAIEKINDADPELLDTDPGLHFALLRLQLIELIRHSHTTGNIQPALEFAASQLAQRAASDSSYLADLEKTMALLCFPVESLLPPLQDLLDINMRREIADQVNAALLHRSGMDGVARIKKLIRLWWWADKRLAEDKHIEYPRLTKKELI